MLVFSAGFLFKDQQKMEFAQVCLHVCLDL